MVLILIPIVVHFLSHYPNVNVVVHFFLSHYPYVNAGSGHLAGRSGRCICSQHRGGSGNDDRSAGLPRTVLARVVGMVKGLGLRI